jgi:hypothetical protein
MVKVALWVRLEARPGKEADVENFSAGASRWFKPSQARQPGSAFGSAHQRSVISRRVAAALKEKGSELFAQPPTIEKVEVLAVNGIRLLGCSLAELCFS